MDDVLDIAALDGHATHLAIGPAGFTTITSPIDRIAYVTARTGHLHTLHDALGRLAFPTEPPPTLPATLVPVAAAQTERRLIETFGTLDRTAQALNGQITYQRQQPAPTPRQDAPGTGADLLTTARTALDRITTDTNPLDENLYDDLSAVSQPDTGGHRQMHMLEEVLADGRAEIRPRGTSVQRLTLSR